MKLVLKMNAGREKDKMQIKRAMALPLHHYPVLPIKQIRPLEWVMGETRTAVVQSRHLAIGQTSHILHMSNVF